MKVLVTGASGLLGRAVHQRCLDQGHQVKALAFTRSDPSKSLQKLDLTDIDALSACLTEFQPDVIVHSAAERRPDVVERDPQGSHAINVEVPANLARLASELSPTPLLINISTDYVFDGSKPPYKVDDQPNPLNAYGVSKLQGERAVAGNARPGHFTNFRVPVLYGRASSNDESAVNVLLNAIQPPNPGAAPKKCDAYAVRYPTSVEDVALALARLAGVFEKQPADAKDIPPTTHFSAKEAMTKYDMCLVLSRVANAVGFETQTGHLDPEYEVDPLAATARPRHCKLDTSVLEGIDVPIETVPFEDWWRPYLTEKLRMQEEEAARLAAEAEAKRLKEEEERQKKEAEEAEARRKKEEEEAAERRKVQEEEEEQRKLKAAKEEEERKRRAEEEAALEAAAAASAATAAAAQEDQPQDAAEQQDGVSSQQKPGDAAEGGTKEPTASTETDEGETTAAFPEQQARSSPQDSPNPSFSSLQARPTPPATSGIPSPTNSVPPSIHNGHRPGSPSHETASAHGSAEAEGAIGSTSEAAALAALASTPTASTSALAGRGAPGVATQPAQEGSGTAIDSPLNLSAASDTRRRGSAGFLNGSGVSGPSRLESLTDEKNLFGGTARTLDIHAAGRGRQHDGDGDNDSDGYGQPSPRTNDAMQGFRSGSGAAADGVMTDAGTGQTASALDATTPPPPQLYHRASFDAVQAQRDQDELDRHTRKKWDFAIRVGDPQKVGDPMTAHIVYTVRTTTDCPHFRAGQFSALRRYKDFRWLHAALVQNNPGVIVPPVPEKVTIGRFAAELVEARRIGLETCINKIAAHPLLQQDDDFRLFVESDQFASDVKQRDLVKGPVVTPEQKTYKSWGSAVMGVSAAIAAGGGHKFHEFDEWFEAQKVYLDSLESSLKQMVRSVTHLSGQRKETAAAIAEMGNVLLKLSGSSLSRSLSTCFAGLAEVQKRAFEVEEGQAEADVRQLGTVMYEYERTVGSVRKAFATRIDVWQLWQKSEDELAKQRNRYDKLKRDQAASASSYHAGTGSSGLSSHMQALLSEVSEAESKALERKREFDVVSERCKREMERLDEERVADFRAAVEAWLQGMVARQDEVVLEWEGYLRLLARQMGASGPSGPSGAEGEGLRLQQTEGSGGTV